MVSLECLKVLDFPKKVITITSDVDYNNKVILNDSMALIAIDNFFGRKPPYV
jgi:hypothetical protein